MTNDATTTMQTVKPGNKSADVATVIPEASDFDAMVLTIGGYSSHIGYEGKRLPRPSSVDQWYAISNLCDTL